MTRRSLSGLALLFAAALLVLAALPLAARDLRFVGGEEPRPNPPTVAIAEALFGPGPMPVLMREEGPVPGWSVERGGQLVGHIASTWELSRSTGYSGQPLDVLVAIDPQARIIGARLMQHSEPILTLGISDSDIARYVGGFADVDLAAGSAAEADLPDVISRATVSTGVIRDSILRTARTLAMGRGLLAGGGIDRVGYEPADWPDLLASGAIRRGAVTLSQARAQMPDAVPPVPEGDAPFVELFAALADPPTIGRNILGQQEYTVAAGALAPGEALLFVGSRGLQSHRGLEWRKSGVFERLTLVQGDERFHFAESGYTRLDRLAAPQAPDLKERSLFVIGAGEGGAAFDPTLPFTLELTATRPTGDGGEQGLTLRLPYELPENFILAPPAEAEPLWVRAWERKWFAVATVAAMMGTLTLILLAQEWLVRRARLYMGVRIAFLSLTLVWLGWLLNGQLSVVQVVAFAHALLTDFRWETFLIEPVIFTLWSGVALGLLFWGRGVFCGWLCPFGALQELSNLLARRFGLRQIAVPAPLHERLWIIKYTLFVAILALSFYSMKDALVLAEAEPFKTAISMRMIRAWPFVLFVLILIGAGLFIERFYCRYLCPLGAGLAIPAKLKIFDWLRRRPQCGRECRLCETKCPVGAIDPLGRINPNECVLCLRCQVIMLDENTCPVLLRRRRSRSAQKPPEAAPASPGVAG